MRHEPKNDIPMTMDYSGLQRPRCVTTTLKASSIVSLEEKNFQVICYVFNTFQWTIHATLKAKFSSKTSGKKLDIEKRDTQQKIRIFERICYVPSQCNKSVKAMKHHTREQKNNYT